MFLGDSIDCAVEVLWELAMTMASLKYIAGMVTQDYEEIRASTELEEENKHTTESHRPSQVDKTEADSDKCLAKNKIIASEEASPNEEDNLSTWTSGLTGNEVKDDDEISMVAHQLPLHDIPVESPEIPLSMVAHRPILIEDILEKEANISMITHQISDGSMPVTQEPDDSVESEENANSSVFSMYAHETHFFEIQEESSEHQVSMVAHFQHRSEEEHGGWSSSMICHQAGEQYDQPNYQLDETEQIEPGNYDEVVSFVNDETTTIKDVEEIDEVSYTKPSTLTEIVNEDKEDNTQVLYLTPAKDEVIYEPLFFPSMVFHQLPFIDIPLDLSEIPVTMVAHFINKDYRNEDQNNISMTAHQTINIDMDTRKTAQIPIIEEITREYGNDPSEMERKLVDDESGYFSSMVANQVPEIDITLELESLGSPVSLSTHVLACKDLEEIIETADNVSMVAHQVTKEERYLDYLGEVEDLEKSETENEVSSKPENSLILSPISEEITSLETKLDTSMFMEEYKEEQIVQSLATDPDSCQVSTDLRFCPSFVAHQLSPLDTPCIFSETPVTMVSHVVYKDQETLENISMLAHQNDNIGINNKEVNIIGIENTICDINEGITLGNEIKSNDVDESLFITSMCNHEIMNFQHSSDSSDFLLSMVSHQQQNQDESTVDATSMVCHHSTEYPNISLTTEYSGGKELFEVDDIGPKSQAFSSTMLAHQLPVADTPDEFPMPPVSMATHVVTDLDEIFHPSSTMLVHQTTNEDVSPNTQRNIENVDCFELAEPIVNSEIASEEESFNIKCVRIADQITEDPFTLLQEHPLCKSEHSVEDVIRDAPVPLSFDEYSEDNDQIIQSVSAETLIVQDLYFLPTMVTHQLPYLATPVEHTEFLSSSASHGYLPINTEDICNVSSMLAHQYLGQPDSDTSVEEYDKQDEESEHISSLASHQLPVSGVSNENRELLISAVTHNIHSDEHNKLIDDYSESSMIVQQINIITGEDKIGNSENENRLPISDKDITPKSNDSWIEGYKVENIENKLITSLVSHQLPGSDATNEDTEFLITSVSHSIAADEPSYSTTLESGSSMLVHHVDEKVITKLSSNCDELNIQTNNPVYKDKTEINAVKQAENEINNSKQKLVEYSINSYTEGTDKQKENICHKESPVGMDETNDNFENVALNSYTSKLTRIQKLQRLVEDEIEEFENKRKNNIKHIENDVETTETHIVNNVKNIEFQSCIVTHQKLYNTNSEEDLDEQTNDEYELTDNESIASSTESLNSVIFTTSENVKCNEEQNSLEDDESSGVYSDQDNGEENVIQASCTLEDNSPIVITTNQLSSPDLKTEEQNFEDKKSFFEEEEPCKEQTHEVKEEFDELKMHFRKAPRRSSSSTTKLRETELLNSFLNEESKETKEKGKIKPQEKMRKGSITLATLNESVKKQTYKIRFKVSINKDNSKASVLQYLFGCFGGEKLFKHQQ